MLQKSKYNIITISYCYWDSTGGKLTIKANNVGDRPISVVEILAIQEGITTTKQLLISKSYLRVIFKLLYELSWSRHFLLGLSLILLKILIKQASFLMKVKFVYYNLSTCCILACNLLDP